MTQTITGCINPVTLTSSGSAAFTAANGDEFYLSVTSAAAPGGSPGVMVVTTTGTITGGTGRFADASGFATIVTVFDAASGTGAATLDGAISMTGP